MKKNVFDYKRNKFFASIFTQRFLEVEKTYYEIYRLIDSNLYLSEVEQKAVNQIQCGFKKFREQIIENCDYHIIEINKATRKKLAELVKFQLKNRDYVKYDDWLAKIDLSEEQIDILLKTVATFQITTGCSTFCKRCNEWALPGTRKHFTFDTVKILTEKLFKSGNKEFAYYGASDPLDWKYEDKNFSDIIDFMDRKGYKSEYGFLTKLPKGSATIACNLLQNNADMAVSITDKNRETAVTIENKTGKKFQVQHDDDNLLIPAGLDEDFSSIKSSITDNYGTEITPEGIFFTIPTFTSTLNLTGQCRIPVTSNTKFFLKKKVGRDGLAVEYFKPLQVVNFRGNTQKLNTLFDAQIENILLDNDSDDVTPPGIMNLHEYFKIFESNAVLSRKKLFRSVVKELRKKILYGKKISESKQLRLKHFKRQVLNYHDFSKLDSISKYKYSAFSFFLKAVSTYLKTHPAEREIILYLRKSDRKKYLKLVEGRTVDTLKEKKNIDTYQLFQALMFKILEDPDNEEVHKFIKKNPAVYDPETDRYIKLNLAADLHS